MDKEFKFDVKRADDVATYWVKIQDECIRKLFNYTYGECADALIFSIAHEFEFTETKGDISGSISKLSKGGVTLLTFDTTTPLKFIVTENYIGMSKDAIRGLQ